MRAWWGCTPANPHFLHNWEILGGEDFPLSSFSPPLPSPSLSFSPLLSSSPLPSSSPLLSSPLSLSLPSFLNLLPYVEKAKEEFEKCLKAGVPLINSISFSS